MSELAAFLKPKECPKGATNITHTRIPGGSMPAGSYHIPECDIQRFYELYYQDVFTTGNKQNFTEVCAMQNTVLRVDLDFKYDHSIISHQHTNEQVIEFVKTWMNNVADILVLTEPVEVITMQKAKPVRKSDINSVMSDGIHILVPNLTTTSPTHLHIRKLTITELDGIFGELPLLTKNWEDVFDKSIYNKTPWQLYGSSKPNGLPYKAYLKIIYCPNERKILSTEKLDSDFDTIDNVKKMTARGTSSSKILELTEIGQKIIGNLMQGTPVGSVAQMPSFDMGMPRRSRQVLWNEEIDEICLHALNIKNDVETHYDDWYKVGQALYNLGPDEPRFFEAFLEYSRKSPKHIEAECQKQWKKFNFRQDGARVSAGTIRHMSRESNPEKYREIQNDCLYELLNTAAFGSAEFDVARVMKKMYEGRFVCVSPKEKIWYEFKGHTWCESRDGMCVRQLLSTEVFARFAQRATYWSLQRDAHATEPEGEDFKKCDENREAFEKMKTKLKKTGFKDNVMKECAEVFYSNDFMEKLDKNTMLLACENGVFDMFEKRFRDGRPEDYISKSTGVYYDPDKKWNEHSKAAELEAFLDAIHPYSEVKDYWLDLEAAGLCGENPQKMWVHTGSGANGKSMKDELMHATLGKYDVRIPVTLFTQKRGKASGPNPELIMLQGVRRASAEEPESGEPLNTGQLKELTGRITCRGLYDKKLLEFDVQARLHILCNKKPKAEADDGGLWRRLEVFDYPIKFVYDTEICEDYHRLRDDTIKQKIPTWAEPMLALLIQRYLEKDGFKKAPTPPQRVLEYTMDYKKANDGVAKFCDDCLVADGDEKNILEKRSLSQSLMNWKRDNLEFNGVKFDDVINHIIKKYGLPSGKPLCWKGLKLVDTSGGGSGGFLM